MPKARTISSRDTSSAPRRSRSAASSAFSQPVSMWMRLHRPCRPSSPCLASQGFNLPSVLTLSCSALSASMRADRSDCFADSWFTANWAARRSSSSWGTLSCSSCSTASASSAASWATDNWLWALSRRASSGAARALRSAIRRSRRWLSWRLCSSTLRCSAASTWICCCTWVTLPRCSLARFCAWRRPSSSAGSASACSSPWAASTTDFSSASTTASASCSSSTLASWLRVDHEAICSFSCSRRCSTRVRPSTTKRISASSLPTSALAS